MVIEGTAGPDWLPGHGRLVARWTQNNALSFFEPGTILRGNIDGKGVCFHGLFGQVVTETMTIRT